MVAVLLGKLLGFIFVGFIAWLFFRVRISCPQCNQKTGLSSSSKKERVRMYYRHSKANGEPDRRFKNNPLIEEFKYFFICKKCGNHFHVIH
ncbi:MAG: hypothetical protein FJX80_03670 [Bacteroidetes bacterium]|nr:hypothetical protein [Bacteroidota bacterium]